ncbi:MAG: hypothetical protein QOJ43_674, partial [Gaiellaceae bacterium]|nr:hypothetical protein [Gaiellaceae bacterium]
MLVALLAALLTGAAPAPAAHPCAAALPRGPDVPAPLILRTSCGGYRLSEDGRVTRLPRHWFAKHAGGTGRRFGADLSIRRTKPGRYLLYRGGQLVWRSSGLYPNDGGGVAFGPGLFAFATYRHGVFLTDLGSPERLVVGGHGAEAIDFTRSGRLIVSRLASLSVISPAGIVERRYRFRPSTGFAFDAASDTVMFVTPAGRLASAAGTTVRLGRTVGEFGGGIGIAGPDLLYFGAADRLTVTRRDGAFVASARWRHGLATDSGVSASPDGRSVAFRLSNVYPGARSGRATVYLVHAGQ